MVDDNKINFNNIDFNNLGNSLPLPFAGASFVTDDPTRIPASSSPKIAGDGEVEGEAEYKTNSGKHILIKAIQDKATKEVVMLQYMDMKRNVLCTWSNKEGVESLSIAHSEGIDEQHPFGKISKTHSINSENGNTFYTFMSVDLDRNGNLIKDTYSEDPISVNDYIKALNGTGLKIKEYDPEFLTKIQNFTKKDGESYDIAMAVGKTKAFPTEGAGHSQLSYFTPTLISAPFASGKTSRTV